MAANSSYLSYLAKDGNVTVPREGGANLPVPVDIPNGGTGATTAAGARTNLVVPEGSTDSTNVVIGEGTSNSGGGNVLIGSGASITFGAISIGAFSSATGVSGTAIGALSSASGFRSIAIGDEASSPGIESIGIGTRVVADKTSSFVVGSFVSPIIAFYSGHGTTSQSPITWGIYGTEGDGTDIAGGDIIVAGGKGTGAGLGGAVRIQTAPEAGSGITPNTLQDALVLTTNAMEFYGDQFFIQDAASPPTVNPVGGGYLYVEAGDLKYRGPNGTITTVALA